MKNFRFISCLALLMMTLSVFGQAKSYTIMPLPASDWCNKNGYVKEENIQGEQKRIMDYERALQENSDLRNVIAKIKELMAEEGVELIDPVAQIEGLRRRATRNAVTVSSKSGSQLMSSSYDDLMQYAKADIIMEISWEVIKNGPKQSISYRLEGKDSYTNKGVAQAVGIGPESFSASVPVMLEEAVVGKMDNFISQLQRHYDEMMEKGREIAIEISVFDNGSGLSLESEYDGEELLEIIDQWINDNSVKHRYTLNDAGETFMKFEQVRIPLYKENGSPLDARQFVSELRKYLSKAPYNITSKLYLIGLGQANLVLGEK